MDELLEFLECTCPLTDLPSVCDGCDFDSPEGCRAEHWQCPYVDFEPYDPTEC